MYPGVFSLSLNTDTGGGRRLQPAAPYRGGGVEPEGVEGEGHQANLRERGCHQSVKILNILAEEEGEKGKLEEKKMEEEDDLSAKLRDYQEVGSGREGKEGRTKGGGRMYKSGNIQVVCESIQAPPGGPLPRNQPHVPVGHLPYRALEAVLIGRASALGVSPPWIPFALCTRCVEKKIRKYSNIICVLLYEENFLGASGG
ncbi:hypothetical protein C8F04DRAFT_1197577 [Mycena alexandri]|uniref:Uncharacterized protein n=1 Tax=Mycena alexandri TaxID=1745969 RepID=A0AAD6WNQ1_9AGAR|nr:hypothetical protein C8F04DRAFT_1197577 [Mycena alexandri]